MSNADIVILTDAMVANLAAAYAGSRLAADIDVSRVYEFDLELETLKDLGSGGQIVVRMSPEDEPDNEAGTQNRSQLILDYRIQVAVAAKIASAANELVDPVLYVLQQLRDYFFRKSAAYVPTGYNQNFYKIETLVYFDRQRLIEQGLIVSVFYLTYRTTRPT
jgi:hypothetical protein